MTVKYAQWWSQWRGSQDTEARDRLVEAYLWLVRYVSGRLMVGLPPQFEQEDVEGHGCFGLLEAINRYDPGRGVRFETYAIPWIRGSCLEGIRAQQWAPAMRRRVRELEKAQAQLEERLGRSPRPEELADELGISMQTLEKRIAEVGCVTVLSLDETFSGDDDSLNLGNCLADLASPDPEVLAESAERQQLLTAAIAGLPPQEQMVVTLYYYEGLLFREIAETLDLSPARISQLHSKAILRLRGKLARRKVLLVQGGAS